MAHIADMEACYDALMGTPTKRAPTQRPGSAKRSSKTPGDRFIPNRRAMDLNVSHFELTRGDAENANASPAKEEYKKELAAKLNMAASNKVLAFSNKAPKPEEGHQNSLRALYSQNREAGLAPKKYTRHIPQAPERILDAPEMLDDYYLNLLDWGRNNVLSVALGGSIYLWNASDGSIQELMQAPGETHVTSVSWMQEGNYLAVGTSDHKVQLWDADKLKQVRSMDGHRARVSSLAWNNHLLSSGGRDSQVVHHDVRVAEHKVGVLRGHTQEVCGLRWSPWGTQLASGGNDNLLNVWDDRYASSATHATDQALYRLDAHQAAVKALAWCPWQRNLLASGGGTADRTIKFWNSTSGAMVNSVDTKSQVCVLTLAQALTLTLTLVRAAVARVGVRGRASEPERERGPRPEQVCALQWSAHDKELVSSHGYSHNQLILWKYPSMVRWLGLA